MTVGVQAIYMNLPVKDLTKSIAFFSALGFEFDENFKDDKGASLIINESIFVMLLTEAFFTSFTHLGIADTSKENEVIIAIQVESKEVVDELLTKAINNGAVDKTYTGTIKYNGVTYNIKNGKVN